MRFSCKIWHLVATVLTTFPKLYQLQRNHSQTREDFSRFHVRGRGPISWMGAVLQHQHSTAPALIGHCLRCCSATAPCGLGSVVEYAHLVSWPSVVRGNWTRVVLFCCILGCLVFLICIEFVYLYFPVLFCLSVSVKWLAVKTASEMTYTVSSGALNYTPTNQLTIQRDRHMDAWQSCRGSCVAYCLRASINSPYWLAKTRFGSVWQWLTTKVTSNKWDFERSLKYLVASFCVILIIPVRTWVIRNNVNSGVTIIFAPSPGSRQTFATG